MRAVADFRRVLDDKAVDAVIVATPDHWHSPAAILAFNAGKHVYVEKPISHNIRESRLLVEAAAHNTIHVRHGTQSRSTGMMIEAIQLLQSGIIGDVLAAKCWNVQRRRSIGRGRYRAADRPRLRTWVGPAPMIPYRTNRVHNRWTMWYHFGVATWATTASTISIRRGGASGEETHPSKSRAGRQILL